MDESKEEPKKGFTKENLKKLFKFEKKDILWLILLIFIWITAWSYYSETKTCKEFIQTPCLQKCLMDKWIEDWKLLNPNKQIIECNYETRSCLFAGVQGQNPNVINSSINFSGIMEDIRNG